MLNELKYNLISSPDDGAIYLIQKLNENAGFFSVNNKLLYLVKNSDHELPQIAKTEYLDLI